MMWSLLSTAHASILVLFYCQCLTPSASDCTKSKQEWMRIRYTSSFANAVSKPPLTEGHSFDICQSPSGRSCCDQQMEREMYAFGQRQLIQKISVTWPRMAEQMHNDSVALGYFFRSDLEQAKNRLHQFFSRIYGYNYKLHRRFFFQFFTNLDDFLAGRRSHLDHLIENFFSQLRDSIVSLIERSGHVGSGPISGQSLAVASSSAEHISGGVNVHNPGGPVDEGTDARRIRCLSDHVAKLRPFDGVDVRLKSRMIEAYPPARMLVNALSVASRLLLQLTNQISVRPECILGMTRSQFCALCAGKSLNAVCPDSCSNLLSSCLQIDGSVNSQLAAIWPRLVDALVSATVRLERPFNLPAVNRNLQMEISEAITSLQTRYEETKSKFESECRFGSLDRNTPTLFSSSGLIGRRQSSSNTWSSNSEGFRRKRDVQYGRMRPQPGPSYVSPEFLDWQTRQKVASAGINNRLPSDSNTFHPPDSLDLSVDRNSKLSWDSSGGDGVSDASERLIRWSNQLKRSYSALGDLFSAPGANLCPPSPFFANGRNATPDCWSPPQITSISTDPQLAETIHLLSEVTERLSQALSNNGDPETLNVQQLVPQQPSGKAIIPSDNLEPGFTDRPPVQPPQWSNPSQLALVDSLENPGDTNEQLFSSGAGANNWEAFPQNQPVGSRVGSPESSNQAAPFESRALHAEYDATGVPPVELSGSGYDERQQYSPYEQPGRGDWSPDPPERLDNGDSNLAPPDVYEAQQRTAHNTIKADFAHSAGSVQTSTTTPIVPPISVISTIQPPTETVTSVESVSPSTDSTSTVTHFSTQSSVIAAATTTSSRMTQPSSPSSSSVIIPSEVSTSTHMASTPSTTESRRSQETLSEIQQPTYGGLPDDEDSISQPVFREGSFPSQSGTSTSIPVEPPLWPGSSPSGETRENLNENRLVDGSGFGNTNGQPHYPEGTFGSPTISRDSSSPRKSVVDSLGSGQGELSPSPREEFPSFGTRPDSPPNVNPLGSFGDYSPSWSNPIQPESVSSALGMVDGDPPDWQGSGLPESSSSLSPPIDAPQIPMAERIPQPTPTPPTPKPSSMPHPFSPPFEIWIPAQLSPGQSYPSVMLARETNVQGLYYGPETMQTSRNGVELTVSLISPINFALIPLLNYLF